MPCCCQVENSRAPESVEAPSLPASPTSAAHGKKGKRASDVVAPDAMVRTPTASTTFTKEELQSSFARIDLDGNGTIEEHEMAGLLDHLGVSFTAKSLRGMFAAIDEDGGGSISQAEFVSFFVDKDKKIGLKAIMAQVIKEKKAALRNGNRRPSDDMQGMLSAIGRAYARDVYITHAMHPVRGARRAWWLARVLEFVDLSCTGPYIMQPLPAAGGGQGGRNSIEMTGDSDASTVVSIEACECMVVLLDADALVTETVITELRKAREAGTKIACFYEGEPNAWEKMQLWRKQFPFLFQRPAVPISRHFLSDSEQLVLKAVHEMLGKEMPRLMNLRPPGGDHDDFTSLRYPGIRWLKASHVARIQRGTSPKDLPEDAFGLPSAHRTCYVSYVQEDPSLPGLSPPQQARLKDAITRNLLQDRVFFLDHASLGDRSFLTECDSPEILSLSRFIIIEDMQPGAVDRRPYLARGPCFLEAIMAVLTGCLAPHRENQFVELDTALGIEIGCGTNLRRFFRENAHRPHKLVNQLCSMFRRKFENRQDEVSAEWILRRALERHPLLVAECAVDPMVLAEEGHQSMASFIL